MTTLPAAPWCKGGTALGAAGALTGPALLDWAKAWAQNAPWKPEKGAKLSMLRWKYFVQSEDDAFVKLIEAFTKATGVQGRHLARVRMKTCSRRPRSPPTPAPARTCSGASTRCRICSRRSASTSPTSPTISARNTAAGSTARSSTARAATSGSASRSAIRGSLMNYRIEASKKAGFSKFPDKTDAFLEYAKAMKTQGHAGRLRARPRLGRRQQLGALVPVVARRQHRRQERQGHHQLAGDRQGAGIRQGSSTAT